VLQILVICRNWCIFLRRAVVVLVWLDTDHGILFHLDLHQTLINNMLVNLVLLAVSVKGSSALRQFFTLVGEELLLVV